MASPVSHQILSFLIPPPSFLQMEPERVIKQPLLNEAGQKVTATITISSDEELELKEIFLLADRDCDQLLSKEDVLDVTRLLKINISRKEVDTLFTSICGDPDIDKIDFDQFILILSSKVKPQYSSADVKSAFFAFENKTKPGTFAGW